MTELTISQINKRYGSRAVLRDVSFEAAGGSVYSVVGANGSGKSTLLSVIAGVVRQDSGSVVIKHNGEEIPNDLRTMSVGLMSPQLNVYPEFTVMETMQIKCELRGLTFHRQQAKELLQRTEIDHRCNDAIGTLSSGLKQRVLLALALYLNPPVLLLDEPSITLDEHGRTMVEREIQAYSQSNLVVVATNDEREKTWCRPGVVLD